MKTDARVRYTRKIIQETFLDILKEKPVEKITVKEICDKAEINRGTFYKHYRDCYDLIEQIEDDVLRQFEEMLVSIKTTGIQAALHAIMEALRNNTQLFCVMADTTGCRRFIHRLMECCFRHINEWPEYSSENNQPEENRIAGFAFLAGGCSGVIEYWLHSGMQRPSEEIAGLIGKFSKNIVEGLSEY